MDLIQTLVTLAKKEQDIELILEKFIDKSDADKMRFGGICIGTRGMEVVQK